MHVAAGRRNVFPVFNEYPDANDSGIDSDDNVQIPERQDLELINASSSEDELQPSRKSWRQRLRDRMNDRNRIEIYFDDDEESLDGWQQLQGDWSKDDNASVNAGSPFKHGASPSLYEVELTASDENDDGSVLELVIPMQTSRYKRVPTSSPPPKMKLPPRGVVKGCFYRMICCIRK